MNLAVGETHGKRYIKPGRRVSDAWIRPTNIPDRIRPRAASSCARIRCQTIPFRDVGAAFLYIRHGKQCQANDSPIRPFRPRSGLEDKATGVSPW
jgi:hypothetical protein